MVEKPRQKPTPTGTTNIAPSQVEATTEFATATVAVVATAKVAVVAEVSQNIDTSQSIPPPPPGGLLSSISIYIIFSLGREDGQQDADAFKSIGNAARLLAKKYRDTRLAELAQEALTQEATRVKKEKEDGGTHKEKFNPNKGPGKGNEKEKKKRKKEGKKTRKEDKTQRKGLQSKGLEYSDDDNHETVVKQEPKAKTTQERKKKKKTVHVTRHDDDNEEDQDDDEDDPEFSEDETSESTSSSDSGCSEPGKNGRYEVKEIVGARVKGKLSQVPVQEFKVKWKGGAVTWETEDRLEACSERIDAWRADCERKAKVKEEAQKQKTERIKPNQPQLDEYTKLVAAFKEKQGKDPNNTQTASMWDLAAAAATRALPPRRART